MIRERLFDIENRIQRACDAAGRARSEVTLIAVSKTQTTSAIEAALALGLRDFGENYAQELEGKASALLGRDVRWHFIGRFQTNKINALKTHVTCWHTLASREHGEALAKRIDHDTQVFAQINLGNETQKAGASLADALPLARALDALSPLRFLGFMCIPPEGDAGPHFQTMQTLADATAQALGRRIALSMGMSEDFEQAIRFGATHVRVGTALFGERQPSPIPQ